MYNSQFTIKFFAFCSLLLASCTSCNQSDKKPIANSQQPATPSYSTPSFNPDSAYSFVKSQVDFGPRVPNTKQHDACAEYLISKMKTYSPNVLVQKGEVTTYTKVKLKIQNVITQFNPETKNRILLFAHWDTRPWADQDTAKQNEPILAADDAGSGVAVLMEIARQLSSQKFSVGVDLIFFDAEDYGAKKEEEAGDDSYALGTQYWCNHLLPENYSANYGILLDMVGAKEATFLQEGFSLQYAPSIVQKVWDTGNRLGFSNYFLYARGGFITDDHAYPNRILNIPCIDIINMKTSTNTFAPHWHTHSDNMDIIDKNTLRAVGQTLLEVIFSEGNL